jgi:SAM-dependent methyltransferase
LGAFEYNNYVVVSGKCNLRHPDPNAKRKAKSCDSLFVWNQGALKPQLNSRKAVDVGDRSLKGILTLAAAVGSNRKFRAAARSGQITGANMSTQTQPSPSLFFETANAFMRTAALKAAVELNLFTAIDKGSVSAAEVAAKIGAPERGTRILCDFLTVIGFLLKQDGRYSLTADSAMFLVQGSPAYLGNALRFLLSPEVTASYADLAETVRRGTTILEKQGTVTPDNPLWVEFARGMAPLMMMPAQMIADLLRFEPNGRTRVLDIAAGHGLFGITLAKRHPNLEVTALDWPRVLEVAKQNAGRAGLDGRYHTLPGDAFAVDFGSGYDVVLLTNFLHHFDIPTCENLLRKVAASLKPGGRVATLEFVLNEDRISPPGVAGFPLIMLTGTPKGDAYTFSQFEAMFAKAGFKRSELHDLSPSFQRLVISYK